MPKWAILWSRARLYEAQSSRLGHLFSVASFTMRAWCPRFASFLWTLTWAEEDSGRVPHPTFLWLGGRGYFRTFSGPYRPHIRSRFFPHIRKGRECVGHPRGSIIGQGVGSRDQALCPRCASCLWTLTWAEEDSGRAAENFQFTISGCPLRFDLHHPFSRKA